MAEPAHAADPTLEDAASALVEVAGKLDELGGLDELGDALPLTPVTPTDLLGLDDVFSSTLGDALATAGPFDAPEELKAAIEDASVAGPGAVVSYGGVSVATAADGLLDVDFTVTIQVSDDPLPIAFEAAGTDLSGGGLVTDATLTGDLSFRLDPTVADPTLAFFLDDEPAFDVSITADGVDGFTDTFGLTDLDVSGTATVDLALTAATADPDGIGGITLDELRSTSIEDLVAVDFDDPAGDEVDIALTLDPVLDGVPEGTVALTDGDPTDGFDPDVTLGELANLANASIDEALAGLSSLVTAVNGVQAAGDLPVPFVAEPLSAAVPLVTDLADFVRGQTAALVVCGSHNTLPPAGADTDGGTVYCQAITAEEPASVDGWDAPEASGTAFVAPGGASADLQDTVGISPTANIELTGLPSGVPDVSVTFTELTEAGEDVERTADRRLRSLQRLQEELAGFGFADPTYDPALDTVFLPLSVSVEPDPLQATLDFGDQLAADSGLVGLSPTSGASASVDPGTAALDVELGIVLVDDPADIEPGDNETTADDDPATFPPGVVDRFVLRAGDGPELSVDSLDVSGTVDLLGHLGFVKVHAAGDGGANPDPGSSEAFAATGPVDGDTLVAVEVDAPGVTVGDPGDTGFTIGDAVVIRRLLDQLADHTEITACDLTASGGLAVDTDLSTDLVPEVAGAGGTVGFRWPQVFDPDACEVDTGALEVTADLDLEDLDLDPENPVALLSHLLDGLDDLADELGEGGPDLLDESLPLIGSSPRDLLGHVGRIPDVLDRLRSGVPLGTITCGTVGSRTLDDGTAAPPSGLLAGLSDATVHCHASVPTGVSGLTWSLEQAGAAPLTGTIADGDVADTVDPDSTVDVAFEGVDGAIGTDFEVVLGFEDTDEAHHRLRLPRHDPPRSLQQLQELIEDELGLGAGALSTAIETVPDPTGGDTEALVLRLTHGVCTPGHPRCDASERELDDDVRVPFALDLGELGFPDLPDIVDASADGELVLSYDASARLHVAFPLSDPTSPFVLDTTGASVEAAVDADDLSVQASLGPFELRLGSGIEIASGSHAAPEDDSGDEGEEEEPEPQPTLRDPSANFVDAGVFVGALLIRETGLGGECDVGAVTPTTLDCVDGATILWDDGDDYRVETVGEAHMDAGFALRAGDGTDGDESFELGSLGSELTASLGGDEALGVEPNDCGTIDDDGTERTLLNDVCARFGFAVLTGDDSSPDVSYEGDIGFDLDLDGSADENTVVQFDLEDVLDGLTLDWSLILKAARELVGQVAGGLDGAAAGTSLPLVGDALDAGADVANQLEGALDDLDGIVSELDEATDAEGVEDAARAFIWSELGGSGGLIRDRSSPPDGPDEDDIDVVARCGGSDCADSASLASIDDLQVTFAIGQGGPADCRDNVDFCETGADLPFEIGLGAVPFGIGATLSTSVGWELLVDFGLDRDHGPYLVTDHGGDPEAEVGAQVGIGAPPDGAADVCADHQPSVDALPDDVTDNYSSARCFAGELGFLALSARDGADTDDETEADDASGIDLSASLDLAEADADDGRIGLDDLLGGGIDPQVDLDADARVNLLFRTGLRGDQTAGFPAILGTFHVEWDDPTDTEALRVAFEDLHLDPGSLATDYLEPIVGEVKRFVGPLRPFIDTIRAPIPVVSDIAELVGAEPIRFIDLMKAAGGDLDLVESLLEFVGFLTDVSDVVDNLTEQGLIGLGPANSAPGPGSFELLAGEALGDPKTPDKAEELIDTGTEEAGGELLSLIGGGDDPDNAFGVSGLSFPFLEGSEIFRAVLGQDVVLAHYDMGTMKATAGFDYSFGPFAVGPVPVVATIGGRATIAGRFAMGYDTSGLRKVLDGGSGTHLFDGIFIDDLCADGSDCPEITFLGEVFAGAAASIAIVEAGLEGGIALTVALNLDDRPEPDGKLRIEEIVDKLDNPICLFEIEGAIEAFLKAFLKFDLGIVTKKYTFELIRLVLLSFGASCDPPDPNLGDVVDGDDDGTDDLVLNLGPRAEKRNVQTGVEDEEFTVRQTSPVGAAPGNPGFTRFAITAFGIYEEEDVPVGGKVIALGASGADVISMEPLIEDNDDGTTTEIPFTVEAEMHGGPGNDELAGGSGDDDITGGLGNDRINGRGGDDHLVGGPPQAVFDVLEEEDKSDADALDGGPGDDVVEGFAQADRIAGGPGADQLFGGSGADSLTGGPGRDPDEAGAGLTDEADLLVGGPGPDSLTGGPGDDWLFGDDVQGGSLPDAGTFAVADVGDHVDVDAACADASSGDERVDAVFGDAGDDHVFGGPAGDEALVGGPGHDRVCGNAGADVLDGDDAEGGTVHGDDRLQGGPGDDELLGRGGHDRLEGGAGNDELGGGDHPDDLLGGPGVDVIRGGPGADVAVGDEGAIDLGHDASDHASAASRRALVEPADDDTAVGLVDCNTPGVGAGNADCVIGGPGDDLLYGEGGFDRLFGDDGADEIHGNSGNDTARGGRHPDRIFGGPDADVLFGDSGDDHIEGNEDPDRIRGGIGQDDLIGGTAYADGDDAPADAGDTIFGDAGHDVIAGDNARITRDADPDVSPVNGAVEREVVLLDVDSTDGSLAGGDVIFGNAGDDRVFGQGNGDDEDDDGDERINEDPIDDLDNDGDGAVDEDGGGDLVHGGPGDDLIEGNAGADWLFGDDGEDDVIGGSSTDGLVSPTSTADGVPDGPDVLVGDESPTGGDDADVLAGDNARITRTVEGDAWATHPVTGDVVRTVQLFDVETVDGDPVDGDASAADVLWGAGGRDLLFGQGGDDTAHGGDGDDYLEGLHGTDTLFGDAGQDDVIGGGSANDGLIVDGRVGDGLLDTNDTIHGDDGDGSTPDDGDVIAGDNALIERRVDGSDWEPHPVTGDAVRDVRLFDVQTLDGDAVDDATSGPDDLFGDGGRDRMFGQGGDDTAHGGDGDDVIEGLHGTDTLFGDAGQDDVIGGGSANDGVIDDDRVGDGLLDTNDTIHGDDGDGSTPDDGDVIAGDNARIDRRVEGADWARHTVTGVALRDVVLFDVEVVPGVLAAAGLGGPTTTATTDVDPDVHGPDDLFGDGGHDDLFGQGAGDTVHGGDGDDVIEGLHGADTLFGDAGQDDVIGGGSANDGVIDDDRVGAGLTDAADTIHGDDGDPATDGDSHDVIAGDNARIVKLVDADDASLWDTDPNTGMILRDIHLFDVQRSVGASIDPGTSGGDTAFGEGGRDLIFGQGNGVPLDPDGDGRIDEDPPNGVDDDRDGRESDGSAEYDCADGRDNDGDGLVDHDEASCTEAIDEEFAGDTLHGGPGHDWIEGNHGGDWILAGDGEDDVIGGSAAGDGVFGSGVSPAKLLDGDDTVTAGSEDDVVLGDNGRIERATDASGIWRRHAGFDYDIVVRLVTISEDPEPDDTYGDDHLSGDAGEDELYGLLGHDWVEGGHGDDALVGDLGVITSRVEDGSNQRTAQPNEPFFEDEIFVEGTLSRFVELFSFRDGEGAEGHDTLLGGDGDDAVHAGPGDDIVNGDGDGGDGDVEDDPDADTRDEDHLFGGDGDDAMWGGRGHDHLWGGYDDDHLDVRPREARSGEKKNDPDFPADPPSWHTYGRFDHYLGVDTIYGGWDQDAMQANVADNGPAVGDRLIDWVGAYNIYYLCPATYGDYVVTRDHSPGIERFLHDLAEGDGAHEPRTEGTSGFRELGFVFRNESGQNANPKHPETPGHFVCT